MYKLGGAFMETIFFVVEFLTKMLFLGTFENQFKKCFQIDHLTIQRENP